MKRSFHSLAICLLLVIDGVATAQAPSIPTTEAIQRPSSWATSVKLEGVPNLFRVTPSLYRSAQPSSDGMKNLKALGVKTIVNLRSFHSDRDKIGTNELGYEHIYMKAWHPEREEVIKFLKIANDPSRGPILLHCQHGADRTGTMVAIYRIAMQGWSKEEAIREMREGGYGFHEVWTNLPKWIDELNIDSIKAEIAQK